MTIKYAKLPRRRITVDASSVQGPLEWWRHTIGHGGINSIPLPERVVKGAAELKPRLIRTFIQEYFNIYPDHGCFDWSRLDPYMDALARTGAKVVAAITIKPRVLFPNIDQSVWKPSSIEEWQNVIYQLVKRYSVDKPIVTYWEIGNEADIGESGGCPYLIACPEEYGEYYKMTIEPILKAFPSAKVGGPAAAGAGSELMRGFIKYCLRTGIQLDFVSWHLYNDDPQRHANTIRNIRAQLAGFPGKIPEMLVTEWNVSFSEVYPPESAFEPRRAAGAAASIFSMLDDGLDWSFYYHVWDQVFYTKEFAHFYEGIEIMLQHWNEMPHRFGLFGVEGEVRPQYFVYRMLGMMGEERLHASSEDGSLRVLAAKDKGKVSVMVANFDLQTSRDFLVPVCYSNLVPGLKKLKIYRIDNQHRWISESLEMIPLEQRDVDTLGNFFTHIYCPADSVTLVTLEEKE